MRRALQLSFAFLALSTASFGQGVWVQQGSELLEPGANYQGFGVAMSADGNTILSTTPYSGAAVFVRSNGTWTEVAKLVCSGAIPDAYSANVAYRVALSADASTAAISGPYDSDNTGAVWVFARSGSGWTQQAKLVGSGAVGAAIQGISIALSGDGNTLAVGGFYDNNETGATWIFTRSGSVWTQQAKLVAASPDRGGQGVSVALSGDGNTVVVGAPAANSLEETGEIWVFSRSGGIWQQQGGALIGTGGVQPGQGDAVAISADGNTIMTSGPGDGQLQGATWTFTRSGSGWLQQGSKLTVAGTTDFGLSLDLSADGSRAVVAGYVGHSPHAWVFARSNDGWTLPDNIPLIDPSPAIAEPVTIGMSANGRTAVFGLSNNNYPNYPIGGAKVFVYGIPTSTTLSVNTLGVYGTPTTLSAAVMPVLADAGVPAGTVTFTEGTTILGSAAIVNGIATLTTILPPGTYSGLMARYSGDGNFLSSTSVEVPAFIIQKGSATIGAPVLVSGSLTFRQSLTIQTTVSASGTMPTGTVSFTDNGIGLGAAAVDTSGVATITTTSIGAGARTILATYNGDGNYLATVASTPLALTINPATAPVKVTSVANVLSYAQPAVFTAVFTGVAGVPVGGAGVVATFVDLAAGFTPVCTGAAVSNSIAICPATLSVGTHSIAVNALTGDSRYQLGPTTAFDVSVSKAGTTVSLSGPAVSQQGTVAVFTATVATVPTAVATLNGTVSFSSNGSPVAACQYLIPANGVSTCSISNPAGLYTVTATYSGDSLTAASSGSTQTTVLAPEIVIANAASYAVSSVSPDEIVALFGTNLTDSMATASAPLPQTIANTMVQVTDSAGDMRNGRLLYISPGQINCVLPAGMASGPATLTVHSPIGSLSKGITIGHVAPGLFSLNANGAGVAAANAVTGKPDGSVIATNAGHLDESSGTYVPLPIDLSSGTIYLVLYGTGLRHVSALSNVTAVVGGQSVPVLYAGETSEYAGFDQINVGPIPASLQGGGPVDVFVSVDGQQSNPVKVTFQ